MSNEQTAKPMLQQAGHQVLKRFQAASQAVKLYPNGNDAVEQAIGALQDATADLIDKEGTLEIRRVSGCIAINQKRLRLDVSNHATFEAFNHSLSRYEIGTLITEKGLESWEWAKFLGLLWEPPPKTDVFELFEEKLLREKIRHIAVGREINGLNKEERKTSAKRVYVQSARVAREMLTGVRIGKAVNIRRVKRSVQSIVDQVLDNENALVGMMTLREFDEYTFTHSVNVCILSVVLGQRLGLDRNMLYELGLCGLLHDIGKMRLRSEVINKPGKLNAEEWEEMQTHPRGGLLALFRIHGFVDTPFRQMLAAYEHHMKFNGKGYPEIFRPREPSLFSRIVSVVDAFDAVTSARSYRSRPWSPDVVLATMRDDPNWGLDRTLVKAFINSTGIYPVGTVVLLDSGSFAVVSETNPESPHAPIVKVISDPGGYPIENPAAVDLSHETPGVPKLRIVRAINAEHAGVKTSPYFA